MNEIMTQAAAGDPWTIAAVVALSLPHVALALRYAINLVPAQTPGTWGWLAVEIAKVVAGYIADRK